MAVTTRLVLAVLVLASAEACAGEMQEREFPIGNATVLTMAVDDTWMQTRPRDQSFGTISLESKTVGRFHLLLTPLPFGSNQSSSGFDVLALVEDKAREIAPTTVKRQVAIIGFRGTHFTGYYFHATRASSKDGGFRYIYQGAAAAGDCVVIFTVLFNDGAEEDASTALSSIQGLRLREQAAL